MVLIDQNIENYVELFSDQESPLLKEISEFTKENVHSPRMLSGHLQGRILSLISRLKRPKNILEIGTYTGYSALCLAEGLSSDGLLITIDKDDDLQKKVALFFNKSHFKNKIIQKTGNALDLIPKINSNIDLVFIDADKKNYKNYFDMIFPKLNIGGLVIVDNVLWKGKVADVKRNQNDKIAVYMNDFNDYIKSNNKVSKLILPVRDGLTIIIKNEN